MVVNSVYASLTCPRCGVKSQTEVEACVDGYGPQNNYRVGDLVSWNPSITTDYGGRPPLGSAIVEGYAVCPTCEKDYFVRVVLESDHIVAADPDASKLGYIE